MTQAEEEATGQENTAKPAVHPLLAMIFGGGKKNSAAPVAKSPPVAAKSAVKGAPAKAGAEKTAPPPMPAGPLTTVLTRNEFYRDGFRSMIRVAVVQSVIIVGLIMALLMYIGGAKPQDRYFATTADGRIMQLVPLDQPNMTPAALMSWVAQSVTEVMTFGFHDYQRRLQQSARHFTKAGWESFTAAMQRARIIDSVQAAQQTVSATPRSAPVLVQQGVFNGKYRWVLQMPIRVTYRSNTTSRTDNLNLNIVVERVPSLENPNGVGIVQWIATN